MVGDKRGKRVIYIAGGGTGGHIFPGLAIANALKNLLPDVSIVFIGGKGKMENEIVPKYGYPVIAFNMRGFSGPLPGKIASLFMLIANTIRLFFLFLKEKPMCVICMGGYESAPAILASRLLGIKIFLQEQNRLPGKVTRYLGWMATRVFTGFPTLKMYERKNYVFTGNPSLRKPIDMPRLSLFSRFNFHYDSNFPVVLVMGGSLGARTLNETGYRLCSQKDFIVLWVCGKYYYNEYLEKLRGLVVEKDGGYARGDNFILFPFYDKMEELYAVCDVVVSRAGAIALTEIALFGKPAIVIPSPNVTDNHQMYNALYLASKNAIILLDEGRAHTIPNMLNYLIKNKEEMEMLAKNIKTVFREDADIIIAKEIYRIVGNSMS